MRFHLKIVFYLVVALCFSLARAGAYEDFFIAVSRDDASAVTLLLMRGFDPNSPNEQGQTALHLALRDNSPGVVRALMVHPGLKVDAANRNDETPLMMAALRGNLESMRQLLQRGATVNRAGWTPLHYAATGPSPQAVGLLLDQGANVDARSPNGSTPLMMAARYGDEASVALLLARGADPHALNQPGLDAAQFARGAGRERLAERLEAAKAGRR